MKKYDKINILYKKIKKKYNYIKKILIINNNKYQEVILKQKKKNYNYINLLNDFKNLTKQNNNKINNIIKNTNKELILKLLPIIDDFERSFLFLKNDNNILLGVNLIYKKFINILHNYGLKKCITKIGDYYNNNIHEVVDKKKSKKFKKKVIGIVQTGYYLNNILIRFNKVIIGV
ncbi:MAG: nucleotide exchange factor GrpE [Candidatus Shikimatogenerans sp. AspAUS03]|uniref:Protein GrpE n=1 Tax=Candidatus Shikimatogenerans sp. AspAUS03 TaxID=3158563 RepID=A0AAU7QS44_9FLAO